MSDLGAEKRLHQYLAAHLGEVNPARAQAALNALTGHLIEIPKYVCDWVDIDGRVNAVAFAADGRTIAYDVTLNVADRIHEVVVVFGDGADHAPLFPEGKKAVRITQVKGLHFPGDSGEPAFWFRVGDRIIAQWGNWSFDIPEPSARPMFWMGDDGFYHAGIVSHEHTRYTEFLRNNETKHVREETGKKIELVGVCAGEAVLIVTEVAYEHWTPTTAGHPKFIHWGVQVSTKMMKVRGIAIRENHLIVSGEDTHRRDVCSEMRQGSDPVELREHVLETYVFGGRLFFATNRYAASVVEYIDSAHVLEPYTQSLPPGFELFDCIGLADGAYVLVALDNGGGIRRPNMKHLYRVSGGKRAEEPIVTSHRFRVFHGQLALEEETDDGYVLGFVGREEQYPLLCGIDRLTEVVGGIMGWHQVGNTLYLIHYPVL